jgi:hypothetical protein
MTFHITFWLHTYHHPMSFKGRTSLREKVEEVKTPHDI